MYKGLQNVNQSILDFRTGTLQPIQKKINTVVLGEDVGGYVNAVSFGRDDVPPNVRDYIKKYQNNTIVKIVIDRSPLKATMEAMNALSLGQIKERMKNTPYDQLFHLRIDITFDNNNVIALEKTSQIAIYPNPILKEGAEQKVVNRLPTGLTLNKLLDGAKRLLGADFLTYDAVDNNCQDFIIALLQGSNIGDNSDYEFVKQDTDLLFRNSMFDTGVRNVAKKFTDLGGYVDTVIHGAGIGEKEVLQSILFERPLWSLNRSVKWLKKRHYKHIVDTKPEHLRFRQHDPKELEHKGYSYITKKVGKGISFIIGVLNNKRYLDSEIKHNKDIATKVKDISMRYLHRKPVESESDYSSSDSESDDDIKGKGMEKDIIGKMNKLRKYIDDHHKIHGGKINIAKSFKKMGSTIKKGFSKELSNLNDVEDKSEKYVTSKGGLAKDLINYGIPAVTGGLGGMAGEVVGGPAGAMVGSAMGSYAGDQLAQYTDKKVGVGKRGSGIKKPRGRPKKEKMMDMIHIDIDSHNAKRDSRGEGLYDKLTLQDIEHIEKLKKEHALLSGIKDKNKVKHLKSEAERLERELEQMGEKGGKKVKRTGIKGRGGMTPLRALKIFGTTADAIYNSPAKDIKPKLMKMRGETSDLRGEGIGPLEGMNPAVMPSDAKPLAVKKARGAGFKKGSQEAKDHMAKIRAMRNSKK